MQIATYDEIPWTLAPGTRGGGNATTEMLLKKGQEGFQYKRLFTGSVGEPGNFEMVVLRTNSTQDIKHYPRHTHAFEQVRLTLEGDPDWTPGVITPEGWVVYMGAGTPYGPYDRQIGHVQLHVQFQGAGCPPFLNYDEMAAARDALTKKGSFEKGVYTWFDEQGRRHNQDGHAAAVAYATGQPVVAPSARLGAPVNMNPEAFRWLPVAAGVDAKELGSFTEGKTRMGFLRLGAGVSYILPVAAQRTLYFVVGGTGTADGQPIVERDGMMQMAGEAGCALKADQSLTLFILALPTVESMQPMPVDTREHKVA
ncbi:MAG TPA: hypothetical protein VL574_12525 [Stellaceae bacterium]|nr:hypothetical protein [Stellaceae bacterium]